MTICHRRAPINLQPGVTENGYLECLFNIFVFILIIILYEK
jgi:hypothetical protein